VLVPAAATAERLGYPPEEFAARRERLAHALGRGTVVLFGATEPSPGVRFRQDNDFFYLTGNESINAVLVLDVVSARATLFLPGLSEVAITYEGPNWLNEPTPAATHQFSAVRPLAELQTFLRQLAQPAASTIWTRLSPHDEVNHGRVDVGLNTTRRRTNPYAQEPTTDEARADALRRNLPGATVGDVTPALDRLRTIKTAREIAILREVGRISAEAMRRAITATRSSRFEYELEAEATHWLTKNGAQAAYPAIVASGPNGNAWHYEDNGRRFQPGDLVVMDYGGSLDHLTIDITRTWPVSGIFTDKQRQAYDCVLEAQQAILGAIKPGVSRAVVRDAAEAVFRRHGFDASHAYVGHYVGLSVHDVGDWDAPFEAGMVLAIEPMVDLPDEHLHVRVEDTVLVTATGVENLTRPWLPADVAPVLALVNGR
jgi:Xaa-Pro aminopeptidase